jgi:hypothetical protein
MELTTQHPTCTTTGIAGKMLLGYRCRFGCMGKAMAATIGAAMAAMAIDVAKITRMGPRRSLGAPR